MSPLEEHKDRLRRLDALLDRARRLEQLILAHLDHRTTMAAHLGYISEVLQAADAGIQRLAASCTYPLE